MRNAFKILVLLGSLSRVLQPQLAEAAQTYEFYQGVRSLGMGGAYTAVVNDETSLLTNPAGLGRLRDVIFTVADPELAGSMNDTEMTTLSNTSAQTPDDLLKLLKTNPGKHWYAKAQAFPSVVAPNFGFGIHGKFQYDAEVNAAGTNYRLDYTNDYAATLGFCFKLFSGILKVGVVGRYVDRTEIHKDIPLPATQSIDVDKYGSEGAGMAGDIGMMITAPVAWLPTLGATVRDAGNTSYTLTNGSFHSTLTRPAPTPQTLDLGYAIFPILANHTRMAITIDVHDVLDANQDPFTVKKVHGGMEFNFADFFYLRGGYNQGYWTGGLEFATEYFQLQAASYGEEIGIQTAPKEDRRWVGKLSIRF
jgi:hypothetical protein